MKWWIIFIFSHGIDGHAIGTFNQCHTTVARIMKGDTRRVSQMLARSAQDGDLIASACVQEDDLRRMAKTSPTKFTIFDDRISP